MSQSNEERKVAPGENRVSVNEYGEVIINDSELAIDTENLSDEELDEIAGGAVNSGCTVTVNVRCAAN